MEECVGDGIFYLGKAIDELENSRDSLIVQAVDDLREILDEIRNGRPSPTQPPQQQKGGSSGKSTCRNCGQTIYWGAHPTQSDKRAPYDENGDLHFATCPQKKTSAREYHSRDELREYLLSQGTYKEASCLNNFAVHLATMKDGREFLRITCKCHSAYLGSLPMTPTNMQMITKEKDWHKKRGREIYGSKSFY